MASDDPIRALLEKQDWSNIHARLVDFATHRSKSPALAKDLAQEAITRVFAYESKWDPAKEPDLTHYLMSVVNSLLSNHRTRHETKRTASMSRPKTARAAEAVGDAQAFSETKAVENDLFSRRMALLTERFAGDARVSCMIQLLVEGVDTPAEIRRRTGWSDAEVASTRRVMLRGAALVARDLGGTSDDESFPSPAGDEDNDDDEEVAR